MAVGPDRRLSAALAVVLATVIGSLTGLVATPGTAWAAWTATGSTTTTIRSVSVPAPSSATARQVGSSVVVSWQASSGSVGSRVDGYVVRRTAGGSGATLVVCRTDRTAGQCTDGSPLPGTVSYTVAATVGAWETAATPVSSTLDTAAPVTTASTQPSANGLGWFTASPVLVTLAAADPAGAGSAVSGVAEVGYRLDGGPVNRSATGTATVSVTGQGTVRLEYWAADNAGNVEAAHTLTLRVDSVAPSAPAALALSADTGASTLDLVTNSTQQTLSGTAEAGSTVSMSYGGKVTGTATAAADGSFHIGPQTLLAGTYAMTFRATDPAGNTSAAAPLTVVVDTTAPTAAVTFPVDTGSYTSTTWPLGCATAGLCGTAADSGSGVTRVVYELRDVAGATCWDGAAFTAAACASLRDATGTTSWRIPVAYTPLPKRKDLRLTLYVDDLAGNRSAALTRTFQVR